MNVHKPIAVLSAVTAFMIAISAFVHIDLAGVYDGNRGTGNDLSQGDVFRLQGYAVIVVGLIVLAAPYLPGKLPLVAFGLGGLALLGSFVAIMVSRYGTLPTLPFVPPMGEATWAVGGDFIGISEKLWSALAEAFGTLTAAAAVLMLVAEPRVTVRVPAHA